MLSLRLRAQFSRDNVVIWLGGWPTTGVVTQRFPREALRDDPNNGCE